MQLRRRIREQYPKGEWFEYLPEKRRDKAKLLFSERKERKEEIDLVECIYLTDKATVFHKSNSLKEVLSIQNKKEWASFMVKLSDLRNKLAHANPIESTEWPGIAEKARKVEEYLAILEK
jgi:hypothetical protein